jgi:hypothetical protein
MAYSLVPKIAPIAGGNYRLSHDPVTVNPVTKMMAQEALQYRIDEDLLTDKDLLAYNITAWLYEGPGGVQGVKVIQNKTMNELNRQLPVAYDQLPVGYHSEPLAAEWFRSREGRGKQVLRIFTERHPCQGLTNCLGLLNTEYPGVPYYYYFDPKIWPQAKRRSQFIRVLKYSYGLP